MVMKLEFRFRLGLPPRRLWPVGTSCGFVRSNFVTW